ncbi:MAG: SMC-Scp complex subunit ScpB [Dethiobacteria bacterium]|jgi:segregation and condensation protein B
MQGKENESLPVSAHKLTLAIVEAALFLSHAPLTFEKLRKICHVTAQQLRDSLIILKKNLEADERGLILLETDQGFQLGTKPDLASYLVTLLGEKEANPPSLSDAALEVLAIIAFKQPVTRLEIEKIRGVNSESVLENLLARGLVELRGRKEALGKPFLYGTTSEFMQYFGLKDIKDLRELGQIIETDR